MTCKTSSIWSLAISLILIILLTSSNVVTTIKLKSFLQATEDARNTCLNFLTNVTIDQIDLTNIIHGSDSFLFHLLDCKVSGLHEYQILPSSTLNPSQGKLKSNVLLLLLLFFLPLHITHLQEKVKK